MNIKNAPLFVMIFLTLSFSFPPNIDISQSQLN